MRYFVSAVETGKFSTAAADCGVTQSAITLALKSLEDHLGASLFDRIPTGVTLTRDGHRFLQKVRSILADVAEATRAFEDRDEHAVGGSLRIGTTDTVIGYFLGPHLMRFRTRFPGIDVSITQHERPDLEERLVRGEFDLGVMLVSNLKRHDKLGSSILYPSQRRLWLPARHAMLERETVSLADVAAEPYIMLTVDEAENTALSYWDRAGIQPRVVLRTANVEAVRTLVGQGMGVTILSDMVFRPWSLEGDRIEVRDLSERIPSMDVGLAWHLTESLSAPAEEFRGFLQAALLRGYPKA
jgi:DNA-binding transcriptional LysR family regulator